MKIIELGPFGGALYTVDLKDTVVQVRTTYNYSAQRWAIDIVDARGNDILTGVALVPNIDLLTAFPQLKKKLGSLVLVELKAGDYKIPEMLGTRTKLLWFAPDEEVTLS